MKWNLSLVALGVCLASSAGLRPALADEGMWLFNSLPKAQLKERYGFEPTPEWTEHVMRSCVRFNSGGSASFVSSSGLVLTNHHVGADTLHKLSSEGKDLYTDGFYAKTLEDEIPAPDLELNQLISIEDVTEKVNAAVKEGMSAAEAALARAAVIEQIQKESLDATGLRSDVITLYGGAQYHLYRFKKYTDVRLVWSPEAGIAFFGGDPDNFEYPRFCLDCCLFRVYEDGKPAQTEHYLRFSEYGAKDGELVFVAGNPGSTHRIYTTAALRFARDHQLPYTLDFLRRKEIMFQQFAQRSLENERRAQDDYFSIQNSRKARTGMIQGLQDPAVMASKQAAEEQLLAEVAKNPKLQKYAAAWKQIEEVIARQKEQLGIPASFSCQYYTLAEALVLMSGEDKKPSQDRLPRFRETARPSLMRQLLSPAPIYPDLEEVKMADALALFVERRGGDSPLVKEVLAGKSPKERAAEVVKGTQLGDVAFRDSLVKGGADAIANCDDPMIKLARLMETESRRVQKLSEEIGEMERQAYAQIADAKFATQGTSTYPDATFSLRLAFGPVKGYEENGNSVAPWTTLGGAFDHEANHAGLDAWKLPPRWHEHKADIEPGTPFNFVCTADIIGGNSGSPVINKNAEFVGIIFDGNIQSLTADYLYTDTQSRAVAVHSAAIRECLRKIYGADRIAKELGN